MESSAVIFPGQMVKTLARRVDSAGSLLSSSDLSAIRLQIFERGTDSPTAAIIGSGSATGVVVATSTATNTLATTGGWSVDEKGFNFSHTYDTASFLTGGRSYRMEYRVTTSSVGVLFVIVNLPVASTGQTAS